jgi:hypothetical protein
MKKRSSIMKDISMSNTRDLNASITTVANDSLTIKGRVNKIDTGSLDLNELQKKNIDLLIKGKYEYTFTYYKNKKINSITSETKYALNLLSINTLLLYSCIPLVGVSCDDERTLEVRNNNTFRIAFKNPNVFIYFDIITNDQTQDDYESCYRECLDKNPNMQLLCDRIC